MFVTSQSASSDTNSQKKQNEVFHKIGVKEPIFTGKISTLIGIPTALEASIFGSLVRVQGMQTVKKCINGLR
jgi:hypothetical protein